MLKGIGFKAQLEEIRKLKANGPTGLASITYLEVPNAFKLLADALPSSERVNTINMVIEFGYVYMYALDGVESFIDTFAETLDTIKSNYNLGNIPNDEDILDIILTLPTLLAEEGLLFPRTQVSKYLSNGTIQLNVYR